MSFPSLRLMRPGLPRSKIRCSKLFQLRNAPFSSASARATQDPRSSGQTAIKGSKKILQIPRATKSPRPPELPSISNAQTAQNLYKENLARVLLDSGETILYQAPSHAGFLTATFVTGTMCLAGAVLTSSTELWKAQAGLPWWINTANRLGIMCFAVLGGWIVLRAARHITSIKLMLRDDKVKMLVTVRRTIPLPFVPSKTIVIRPVDFVLPSRMVTQLSVPKWLDNQDHDITGPLPLRIIKRISLMLWTYFAGMRKVFTHEGFLDVKINGTRGVWKLDTAGHFASGGRNLLDIVSFETDGP
jgi:hypothetical protein